MRKSDAAKTQKRKNKILHAAVHHYIKTGAPASSKLLVGEYGLDCSSATVRNILSELENDGYLVQPHTSAGRVPTDKGYRAYVDTLEGARRVALDEASRLRKAYGAKMSELEDVIAKTSKVLTALSHYSGFVSLPSKERTRIKDIELITVPGGKTLFVVVTNTGLVRHRLFRFSLSAGNLGYVASVLRERLIDVSLEEAEKLLSVISDELRYKASEFEGMENFLAGAFDYDDDLRIDGIPNILALPEFRELNVGDLLFSAPGAKAGALARVIKESIVSDDIKVIIGSETRCKGFECVSAVMRTYKKDDRPIGVLGILGPKRMEYRRMMSIVESVSDMLEQTLKKI